MIAKGQITVTNIDDGKTPFLYQAYKMKDGRFLKHYPVYEASPISGYKEGDLWHRTDGSQPGYFVANKSNTTLKLSDWTFYANELTHNDTDKFYPKFEGTYSDYNKVASDDQTKYTWKIIKADDGIGIKSVTEYYLATSESSGIKYTDKRFTTKMQPMTATNKYLWNYEKINFSNNKSQPTIPVIIGVYGDKGQPGGTGATGRSITAIQEYYLATSASKDVKRPNTDGTNGWTTTMQSTTETNKYLWNYEKITWSSGTTTTYVEPVIIGTHGKKGDRGNPGADSKLLYLSATAEAMTFNSDNTPNPATQTITFTANMQNTTGTATFTAIPYNGATAMTAITLGGTRNTRTLTQNQFPTDATRIEIKAVLGSLSDTVSVVKLKNGANGANGGIGATGKNAIVGYLTNENITFPANSSGVVTSANLAMANGVFKVFDGLTEKTGSTSIKYSVENQTEATGAITNAGAYSVSKISADNASITFRAIYNSSVTIDKVLTLSKSKEGLKGDKGDNAPLVKLSGATQIITESSTGTGTPKRTPDKDFTVVGTSVNTSISSWTYSVNGGTFGIELPRGVSRDGNTVKIIPGSITFNTLSIKATGGGVSDTFTIARIVDGEKGAKGDPGSPGGTGSAGKDAYTVLLSNESHTFQAGTTNAVEGSTTTDIYAYKGTNRVAVTVGAITGMPEGMTGTVIDNGKVNARITFTVATKMTRPSGTVIINLTVDNKPIVKEFSYALTFKGQNAVVGLLTNESITLPANKDGLVPSTSFTGAKGVFDVYDGITKKTVSGLVKYSVVSQSNITVGINATTGAYSVTAMPRATPTGTIILNGYATLKAIYNGVTIEKQLNVAKSLTGATGAPGARGPQGATGSRGPVGATGTSVSSVTEYYLATSEPSGIKDTDKRFTTAMQPMTATNKYLWNYEKINFSNNTSQPTIPVIIGVYGDKGQPGGTGATGRSITSITEHYLATSAKTGVSRSTSGWGTSMKPTTPTNKYLWNYETINWSSGTTPTYVEPIIIGVHGDKGASATSYWITASNNIIGKSQTGVINPTTITFKGFSKTGTSNPVAYSGRFIIQTSTNGTTYTTRYDSNNINESSRTYTIPANALFVKCLFYMAGGTTVLLDEQTVPIVESAEGIQVGGENMLQNTAFQEGLKHWSVDSSLYTPTVADGVITLKNKSGGRWPRFYSISPRLSEIKKGDIYTLSFEAKGDTRAGDGVAISKANASNTIMRKSVDYSPEWKRYTITFTASLDWVEGVRLEVWTNKDASTSELTTSYRKFKLERGSVATDWTPAPEDTRTYKAWANSSDGTVDFTRVYPNENLIRNSSNFQDTSYWTPNGGATLSVEDGYLSVKSSNTTGQYRGAYTTFDIAGQKNKKLTITTRVKKGSTDTSNEKLSYIWHYLRADGSMHSQEAASGVYKISLTDEEQEYSFSATLPNTDEIVSVRPLFQRSMAGGVYHVLHKWMKAEIGEQTIYTTSPQDSLSGSVPKYVGLSPQNSDNPSDYTWIVNPDYAENSSREYAESKIEQTSKDILTTVTESFVAEEDYTQYREDIATQFQQTATDFNLLFSTVSKEVKKVESGSETKFEKIEKYIRFVDGKIVLGTSDSDSVLEISNDRISFKQGGNEVAHFAGQTFTISKGILTDSMQVGDHRMTKNAGGLTTFDYIP